MNFEQNHALKNRQVYTNSVVIGPPGTGKTYSICAMAIDAILKKESVLVVSKTKQAVEVVRNKLIRDYDMKNDIIYTSSHRFKHSLTSKIKNKLSGIGPKHAKNSNKAKILYSRSIELNNKFEEIVEKELKLSKLSFQDKLSIKEHIQFIYQKLFSNNKLDFITTANQLDQTTKQLSKDLKVYVKESLELESSVQLFHYRTTLTKYLSAIQDSNFTESQRLMESIDFTQIVSIYPLWLVHLSELNTVLPLDKEIFDLVIIDEATQCDIATALPAIFRAKRVVICGDPHQLKHYSFVGQSHQNALREKFNLPNVLIFDYRNKSILDVYLSKLSNQNQITFLREHYRSSPSLIQFNNNYFYKNQLEIIKSTTDYTTTNQNHITCVDGFRDSKGINHKEAENVIAKLKELIGANANNQDAPSIGIIAPFADQARYINK